MKKKIIITLAVIILLVLLFPIRNQLKDGGTVEYKALIYKISKVKRLTIEEKKLEDLKIKKYEQGIIIEILGFEVYNNVE